MAEHIQRYWKPQFQGLTRRDRRGCSYYAYLPDALSGWELTLPSDLAADIADAENAIRNLNQGGTSHVSLEGLARFLLRAESVASSKIEGLDAGIRRLVEAETLLSQGGEVADRVAIEILGNIASMNSAIEHATNRDQIALEHLREIHRTLMEHSPAPDLGGVVRVEQNWIGGSSYNPCSAEFVPPPPESVDNLLTDLLRYTNSDDHSPLVQSALAHAQFETIHPFIDGNGRTGRALIHIVLQRREVSTTFVPPISLVLATWSDDYIGGLSAFRHLGDADSPERSEAAHVWLRVFAAATIRACADAEAYALRIDELSEKWRAKLGSIRSESALDLLIDVMPGVPLLTVTSAAELTDRSEVAVGAAINRMVEAGVLSQRNVGKQRYRIFEAPDVLDLFTSLERALASPGGNTLTQPPVRPVPAPRHSG